GKGMRVVADESELEAAVESARREADAAFGDGRIFLEKLLERPRHVEVQILADAFGNMVHLGERDCSTQRRHQKVVEEAPSPIITAEMRAAMGDSALRLARATGYVNAGTVEFLFEGDAYYFLEVNTRLQVEHPVTELVTGVDLVRMQIEIAAGQRLAISQEDVQLRGHAIEARVYAEDPDRRFLPAAGPVHIFRPPNGPGARNDVGVAAGDAVTSFYDPLMAKLIVHAETRPLAVARLRDALHRYDIAGPTTNLAFLRWIAGHPRFHDGRVDITFVDEEWQPSAGEGVPNEALIAAALADALGTSINDSQPNSDAEARPDPWRVTSGWRAAGMSRTFAYSYAEHCWNVGVTPLADGTWQVVVGEDRYEARVEAVVRGRMVFRLGSAVFEARADSQPDARTVSLDGRTYVLTRPTFDGGAQGMNSGSDAGLNAPMPGTIVKIVVAEGQTVEAREPLVILEAMKMEHVIEAPHAGVVRSILYREGDLVPAGAPLVRLESP
ncbi:MAG TPA: biotin/lipoyl-containing protein, partial [Chloroflexota bacterium]